MTHKEKGLKQRQGPGLGKRTGGYSAQVEGLISDRNRETFLSSLTRRGEWNKREGTDTGRPVHCTCFPGGINSKSTVKHECGRGNSSHKKEK